jgi:DNA-binding XRE family transcriptional regulator
VYLRNAREARDLTQTQLGLLATVRQHTISKLETREQYHVGFDIALRLARALKIPAERLRFGPDPARKRAAALAAKRAAARRATADEVSL